MDSVYEHGLKVLQSYENPILEEWTNILEHLEESGGKSAKSIKTAIHFLTDYFFDSRYDSSNLTKTESAASTSVLMTPLDVDQIMITLLENATHKVIQDANNHTYEDHQAIQFVFTRVSEQIDLSHDHFSIDTFLHSLASSNQLPIEWVAIANRSDNVYTVKRWFNHLNQDLLLGSDFLKANSIFDLSEQLLQQMEQESQNNYNVVPIPHDDETLLVCIDSKETSHIVPFITHALQNFQEGSQSLKRVQESQQWKDSVILFNEKIMVSQTYQEAVENITAGFVNYLPFERCALFSLSADDQMGVGLHGQHLDNEAIRNITENVKNLPIIQKNLDFLNLFNQNLNYLRPIYIKNASIGFPEAYIQQFELRTVVVVPIFTSSDNKLLGAAILDQGANQYFKLEQETFAALKRFGQSAGEILSRFSSELDDESSNSNTLQLSPREIDVLKLMAEGASTNSAAGQLHLSEYTVRDYVSAIMQKMKANNRTEAVARAIREGLI